MVKQHTLWPWSKLHSLTTVKQHTLRPQSNSTFFYHGQTTHSLITVKQNTLRPQSHSTLFDHGKTYALQPLAKQAETLRCWHNIPTHDDLFLLNLRAFLSTTSLNSLRRTCRPTRTEALQQHVLWHVIICKSLTWKSFPLRIMVPVLTWRRWRACWNWSR